MEKAASAASYTASGGAILFGLTANEIGIYVGVVIAILTFFANLWFRWQTLKVVKRAAETKALVLQEDDS